jgi:hypothetical protein
MQICQDCRNIDFSLAMTEKQCLHELYRQGRLARGIFVSRLDHFSSDCALCLKFDTAKSISQGGPNRSYDLRAFRLPGSYRLLVRTTVLSPPHTVWLLLTSCDEIQIDLNIKGFADVAERLGWIASHLTTDRQCMFRPQLVHKKFDRALVKTWLSRCKAKHGNSCNDSANMSGLVLIDCVNLQLCYASKQDEYVALSSVEG